MKLLHIISQRPECTGSGIYLQAIIRQAALKGYTNHLVAGIPDAGSPGPGIIDRNHATFVRFETENLPFPVTGMSDVMPYESSRFSEMTGLRKSQYETAFREAITDAVKRFRPDIIHSHHLWLVSSLTRSLFPDIPMVTSCHGTDLRQFANCPDLNEDIRKNCMQINEIFALNIHQKAEIQSVYGISPDHIHVVGGGFNDGLFGPPAKKDSGTIQILYAGKLSESKGVPMLLRAVSQLKTGNWHLNIAGSGTGAENSLCLELAEKLGNRATLHGALSQSALADLMKASHIFVLPSFFEGLPLVLLEALASGCRIVATSLPGVTGIMGSGGERNFVSMVDLPELETIDKPYDSDMPMLEKNLARALDIQVENAIKCPDINMSDTKHITSRYTWAGVFERIEAVYKKVLRFRS